MRGDGQCLYTLHSTKIRFIRAGANRPTPAHPEIKPGSEGDVHVDMSIFLLVLIYLKLLDGHVVEVWVYVDMAIKWMSAYLVQFSKSRFGLRSGPL